MPAVDSFLKSVLRSGLLDSEQLQSAVRAAPPDSRSAPESLADHLVKAGKLSRYQALKLLQGQCWGWYWGLSNSVASRQGGMARFTWRATAEI